MLEKFIQYKSYVTIIVQHSLHNQDQIPFWEQVRNQILHVYLVKDLEKHQCRNTNTMTSYFY